MVLKSEFENRKNLKRNGWGDSGTMLHSFSSSTTFSISTIHKHSILSPILILSTLILILIHWLSPNHSHSPVSIHFYLYISTPFPIPTLILVNFSPLIPTYQLYNPGHPLLFTYFYLSTIFTLIPISTPITSV